MEFVIENGVLIVAAAAVVGVGICAVRRFVKKSTTEQIAKVKKWLLFAVTKAEKELGKKTGEIKLRYVYDMFANRFPWLTKIISFDFFSTMVDEALDQMKELLDNNDAVKGYVDGSGND